MHWRRNWPASAASRFGFLGEAANTVGGYLAGAVPFGASAGLDAAQMLAQPRKAYLVLGMPSRNSTAPIRRQALAALKAAESVVVLSSFKNRAALDYADCLLPIAPFTETSGTFVNTEGRVQSFNAVVKPLGETRPAWKVLRVLGNLLGLAGFEQDSSEAVRERDRRRRARRAPRQRGSRRHDQSGGGRSGYPARRRCADLLRRSRWHAAPRRCSRRAMRRRRGRA